MQHDVNDLLSELAIMRDNLKIGIFFMDRKYIIQSNYSGYLGAMFSNPDLGGKNFLDIIAPCVTPSELQAIKDYFDMIFEEAHEQYILDEINPLIELEFNAPGSSKAKYFQFDFVPIHRSSGEKFALVSVYDITPRVELRKQLQEEGSRRQEEMKAVFELIQIEPYVLDEFIEDMEVEFGEINKALSNSDLSVQDKLIRVYQSVHSIKSNAFTLEQNSFGEKVHKIEAKIKKLREKDDFSSDDMTILTKDIENLVLQKEDFKETREKIKLHKSYEEIDGEDQSQKLLVNSLIYTANRVSHDLYKKVKLIIGTIENSIISRNMRHIIKDIFIQLIRNSIVHGIETPEERLAAGKDKTGLIHISVKLKDDKINVKLADNGKGFDYKKIAEKALQLKLIKPEDKNNKEELLKAVFSPGFTTIDSDGIHGGRGIGLNMVRDRVREHKGTIKVQSIQGKGTVFHIFFPVK